MSSELFTKLRHIIPTSSISIEQMNKIEQSSGHTKQFKGGYKSIFRTKN